MVVIMWKQQLRTKTSNATMDLDIKPTPKRKMPKCREEFLAMKGKLESKIQEIIPKQHTAVRNNEFTDDYAFNITGLNKYFNESIENIPDEFFCKVLDSIKNLNKNNNWDNPITFEFQYLDDETGELKDDTFYVFCGVSYEPHAGLSYYNYSAIYLILRDEMNSHNNLVYMDLGFKGKDGYSFVPRPNFDLWKWW